MTSFSGVFYFVVLVFIMLVAAKIFRASLFSSTHSRFQAMKDRVRFPAQNLTALNKEYECEHCGAGLGKNADVSPSGDVKCQYCNKWFNIHRNVS